MPRPVGNRALGLDLLGRPVAEMVDMPNIAAATLIVFGDFSGYRIAGRVGPSTLRDPF